MIRDECSMSDLATFYAEDTHSPFREVYDYLVHLDCDALYGLMAYRARMLEGRC